MDMSTHVYKCWINLERNGGKCTCPNSEPLFKDNPNLGEESDSEFKGLLHYVKNMELSDSVNHPTHYGGEENPFEPIKIIEHYKLNFSLGNVIKYVLRAGKKNDELEDLKKAHFYLGREIEKLSNQ